MENEKKAEKAVDEIERGFGIHPGYRRAHARGVICEARFTPNGNAREWTDSPLFTQGPVRAIVRFSHSSPNPDWLDAQSPVKGMAVRFEPDSGGPAAVVGVTAPVFMARTPETFNEMIGIFASFREGRPRLRDLIRLFSDYPDSRAALKVLWKLQAPESYATGRYHSMHAYFFVKADGKRKPVKYEWEPDAGVKTVSRPKEAGLEKGHFEEELKERLMQGPVGFRLMIRLGEAEDPTDDPTKEWPDDRRRVDIGHLEILQQTEGLDTMKFDPTEVPEGVECSDDPILHFRHKAYSVSHERRLEEL